MDEFRNERSGTGSAAQFVRWDGPRLAVRELARRNAVLCGVAALQTALLVAFLAGIALDPRTVGGDPVWLKPATFAGSIALFTATFGWIGYHLPVSERFLRRVSIGIAAAAIIEIVLIGGQAGRGVESHFNDSTLLDQSVYAIMGVTIVVMTALVAWLLVRSWRREFDVAPAFAWGIRAGIALFVVGAFEGGAMVALETAALGSGQTVPVTGWVLSGDFRVAHFAGLHALQALPLVGYLAAVAAERGSLERPVRIVRLVGGVYALVLLALFLHALTPVIW
ncbi:hypothetical protein GS429_02870 [Natronorubrum sp. JWXQ-INN-674]|uniref:Uncharacterized protein n=1 Tax=Natronorubrum halalkaliphilum TaxID=2691917 RepID=A0A6B0VIU2_9EURY|nr:hypothetical protein [Natronorubrum halalkaliphilum]MXV61017.1 hypothetical protein [Natronorubrum halalkaliphilum]